MAFRTTSDLSRFFAHKVMFSAVPASHLDQLATLTPALGQLETLTPGITQHEACGQWVVGIDADLVQAVNPGAPGDSR
ncbi:hypothetical protein EMIT0P253_20252 [Pseudomonas sp. IT-P253]